MYVRWRDLTDQERGIINNGCGPSWANRRIKRWVNKYLFAWMFYASCGHHDLGYTLGGGEKRRLYCDLKLTQAMWKDIWLCYKHGSYGNFVIGFFIGNIFSALVILFGWLSFQYGEPKDKEKLMQFVLMANVKKPTIFVRLSKWRWNYDS